MVKKVASKVKILEKKNEICLLYTNILKLDKKYKPVEENIAKLAVFYAL